MRRTFLVATAFLLAVPAPSLFAWGEDGHRIVCEIGVSLDDQREEWLDSEPIDWAQESYEITRTDKVDYCRMEDGECTRELHVCVLGQKYQKEFEDDVAVRLKKAGVRLAQRIKDNL